MAGRHPEDVDAASEDVAIEDETTDAVDSADEAVTEEVATVDADDVADDGERSERVVDYWAALGIDPVEVSFPRGGTGLTLRQYRVAPEPEPDDEDEDDLADVDASADDVDADFDDEDDEDEDAPAARAGVAPGEEEAFFLATNGKLHMFREPASLVEFVKTDTANDLYGSDNWDDLVATLTPEVLVPDDEDRYELDLVVENLRGGHDVWEPDLIVGAGEFARDIAYALGLSEVRAVLASGSPLDDLDEALRSKGFFARRKLKKIGPEQASLGWRTVIGRITSSVEWHD